MALCNNVTDKGFTQQVFIEKKLGEKLANSLVNKYSKNGTFDGFGYINNTNTKSILFDRLDAEFGESIATQVYAELNSPSFINSFGDWTTPLSINQKIAFDKHNEKINKFPYRSLKSLGYSDVAIRSIINAFEEFKQRFDNAEFKFLDESNQITNIPNNRIVFVSNNKIYDINGNNISNVSQYKVDNSEVNNLNEPELMQDSTTIYANTPKGRYILIQKNMINVLGYKTRNHKIKTPATYIPTFKDTLEPEITDEKIKKQIERLSSIFNKYGLKINVVVDNEIEESGSIEKKGDVVTLTINLNKIKDDSIFHEFGHLYTELITDKEFIQKGIDQLRGTDLWKKIQQVYPDYYGYKLGMEVLTTKIGMEAQKMADNKFKFWLNRFFDRLAKLLGIKRDIAKSLAIDLINGNIRNRIDATAKMQTQYQRIYTKADAYKTLGEFIRNAKEPMKNYIYANKDILGYKEEFIESRKLLKFIEEFTHQGESQDFFEQYNEIEYADVVLKIVENTNRWKAEYDKQLLVLENFINKHRGEEYKNFTRDDQIEMAKQLYKLDKLKNLFYHIENFKGFSEEFMKDLKELDKLRVRIEEIDKEILKADLDKRTALLEEKLMLESDIAHLTFEQEETENLQAAIKELDEGHKAISADLSKNEERFKDLLRDFGAITILNSSTDIETMQRAYDIYDTELLDSNKMAKLLISNFDSMNRLIATSESVRRIKAEQTKLEIARKTLEFKEFTKNYKDFDYKSIYKEYKYKDVNGNITKEVKLVSKYDWEKLFKTVDDYYTDAKGRYSREEVLNSLTDTATDEEIETRIQEKKDEYNIDNNPTEEEQQEFALWYNINFRYDYENDEYKPRIGGEFKIPKDEYIDEEWVDIQNSEYKKAIYDYLLDLERDLVKHTFQLKEYNGRIPVVNVDYNKNIGFPALEETDKYGNPVRRIRMRTIADAVQKPLYYIHNATQKEEESDEDFQKRVTTQVNARYNTNFQTIQEIEEANAKIKEENLDRYERTLSYDLNTVFPMFIQSALEHKYKTEMEAHYQMTLASLANTTVVKYGLKDVYDPNKVDRYGNKVKTSIPGKNSKEYERFSIDMDMKLYGKFLKPNKFNNNLIWARNYVALLGLGFNVQAAAKNFIMGDRQLFIEATSGVHFNKEDLKKGKTRYNKNISSLYNSTGNDEYGSTKTAAIAKLFNVIEDYDDIIERAGKLDVIVEQETKKAKIYKKSKSKFYNVAFYMTTKAENMLHNATLFAMLNSHRVIDGKIVSRFDYINNKTNEEFDKTIDELRELKKEGKFKEFIKQKNEYKKELEEKFENVGNSIEDFIDFKQTGERFFADIKKDEDGNDLINEEEIVKFKLKVQGVNHKMHGIYNMEDKGVIENSILGQLIMQFKHWLPAMWIRRFGIYGMPLSSEPYMWNVRREEQMIGDYNVFWDKIIRQGYKEKMTQVKNDLGKDKLDAITWFQTFFKSLYFITRNAKIYYHTLNPYEQAGITRTVTEFMNIGLFILLTTFGTAALIMLLGALGGGDDDDWMYNYIINMYKYTSQSLVNELAAFTPYGLVSEFYKLKQNPLATFQKAEALAKASSELLKYPFLDDEERVFRSGYRKGQVKVIGYGKELMPLVGQIQRNIRMTNKGQSQVYSMWNW